MELKADSLADLAKQLLRALAKYCKATALEIAISTGKKMALFIAAITCLILALVYLSMGLVRALASLFFHPAPPYLILGGILLVAAALILMIATKNRPKADENAREPEDTQCNARPGS